MGLKEKYLVCPVGSRIFSKCYPLLLLFLMEVHPNSEILEQTRVSQRKVIEIQVSSRSRLSHSLSKEGLSLAKTGLSHSCVVWKESCVMLFTYIHTERTFIMWFSGTRTMYMFKLANKWVSFITRAFIFMMGIQQACFSKVGHMLNCKHAFVRISANISHKNYEDKIEESVVSGFGEFKLDTLQLFL